MSIINAARQFAAAGQFGGTATYEQDMPRSLVELNAPLLAKSLAKEEAETAAREQAERDALAMRQAAEGSARVDAAVERFEGLPLAVQPCDLPLAGLSDGIDHVKPYSGLRRHNSPSRV